MCYFVIAIIMDSRQKVIQSVFWPIEVNQDPPETYLRLSEIRVVLHGI